MLDLFPIIKRNVLEMIKNNRHKLDIYEYIEGQKSVYSIDIKEAKELKEIVNNLL